MKIMSIYLRDELWEEVQNFAKKRDLKINAIFRLGFRKLIEAEQGKK